MNTHKTGTISIVLHPYTNIFLLFGALFCVAAYVFFANMAVREVSLLEQAKADKDALTAKVSDLESRNLNMAGDLSVSKAKNLGLAEANKPIFIVKTKKEALSINLR